MEQNNFDKKMANRWSTFVIAFLLVLFIMSIGFMPQCNGQKLPKWKALIHVSINDVHTVKNDSTTFKEKIPKGHIIYDESTKQFYISGGNSNHAKIKTGILIGMQKDKRGDPYFTKNTLIRLDSMIKKRGDILLKEFN